MREKHLCHLLMLQKLQDRECGNSGERFSVLNEPLTVLGERRLNHPKGFLPAPCVLGEGACPAVPQLC